jgi:broad specificity phosphatase PhoE
MTAPLTLYFVRHGNVHNPEGILYGRRPDFHLSDEGKEQAAAAGRYLAEQPLTTLYASPMERAQETAGIIEAAHPDISDIVTDERLNEVMMPHEGWTHDELEKIHFDVYTDSVPPFEQPRDIRRRVLEFIASMREKHGNETIAAVTHGDIVAALFIYAHGGDENDIGRSRHETSRTRLMDMGLPEYYPATASITRLTYHSDDPNEVPEYLYIKPY